LAASSKFWPTAAAVVAAGGALFLSTGGAMAQSVTTPAVTTACLTTMRCDGTISWPSVAGPVTGGSFSPLSQINTHNVKGLTVAWKLAEPSMQGGMENYPVVVGDVAYLEGPNGVVMAVNAATGKTIWTFSAPVVAVAGSYGAMLRGVAVGDGKVFMITKYDVLYALNQATGAVEWKVTVANYKKGNQQSAPLLYDNGAVFVGSAGSDNAIRGYEEARSAASGKLLWIHWNAPSVGHGWVTQPGTGGGDTWMNPTPGPDGLLYFSTGNPAPDLYGKNRPGADVGTDSIDAVNIHTGKQVWSYQVVPHDLWDYDSASPPVVFKTAAGWVVGEASKSGYWVELDALTGQPVTFPEPFVTENHVAPPMNGKYVLNWPGVLGGSEWSPVSYDPLTQMAYIQGNNIPMLETAAPMKGPYNPDAIDLGTVAKPPQVGIHTGTFTAMDVGSGTVVWQDSTPYPTSGGLVTTAGGLAFGGIDNGVFEAMDAKTGKVLWSTNVHTSIGDAPIVYSVGGREYVLLAVGGSLIFQYSKSGYHAGYVAFALPSK
jgi:alcohol dehydrogenase (cytochrome c)